METNETTPAQGHTVERRMDGDPHPGQFYSHTLRTPTARWWKPVVGIIGGSVLLLLASIVASLAAMAIDVAAFGRPFSVGVLTPTMYAATMLSLILLIPITWVFVRFLHGQRWGFNGSIEGRLRTGWMVRALPVLLVVFAVYMIAFMQLTPDMGERSPNWLSFAVIALLLMPFQAAAEEVFFRGYVQRAAGSWLGGEKAAFVVGTLISASLFAAFHFAQDPWLVFYYFSFGVTLSIAARLTGGLEIPILLHAVNNVVSGVIGAYTSDMAHAFDRSVGVGGPFMLVQVVFVALVVAVLVWWARRSGLRSQVPA